jgi:hypothetical protein
MSGKQYGAYARVPICRACSNPFVPPGHDGCCSVRCVQYLEVARQPVLGDPIWCQRDEPIKCWGCEVSFMSRGLRICPECFFRARPGPGSIGGTGSTEAEGETGVTVTPIPARHDEPINDRNPHTLCYW